MNTPTNPFRLQDFRLLRRPCKRYNTSPVETQHSTSVLVHGAHTTYAPGGRGAAIGDGCYRTRPAHGNGNN